MIICNCSLCWLRKGAHDVIITVKEVLLVVSEGHLGAAVLGEEDGLALLDGAGAEGAVVEEAAGAGGDDQDRKSVV